MDHLRAKLIGWKIKTFSYAIRLILVEHVLSAILIHISLYIPTPKKTCLLLEKIIENFLCLAKETKSKSNFVHWDKVCLPKVEGGLGIRRVKDLMLRACLI